MSASRPFSLKAYAGATRALAPLAPLILAARARRGKEDPSRRGERLGHASLARPEGPLAWLHGASVGEGLSLLPLVARFRELSPEVSVLVTSGTRASAEVLRARLPVGAFHQFTPLDTPAAVARFIDHWRPDLGVFVESELWPNLIGEAKRSGTRLALVSARMSAASFRAWRRYPRAATAVLGDFALVLARDAEAAARFTRLGAKVEGEWDAKLGAPPLPADPVALAELEKAVAGHGVILAASTHPGEEGQILTAFQAAADETALLIIVPRHPTRGREVEALVRGQGQTVARRSTGETPGDARVYIADTLGELGLFYRLARVAIMGGSLVEGVGGHNPLEPARLGCPFIAGSYVDHWPIYAKFVAAEATRLVDRPKSLAVILRQAVSEDGAAMAARAAEVVRRNDTENQSLAPRLLALIDR